MVKEQSEKFSSNGKIVRVLLTIFILQFVAFTSTKAQMDYLDNLKKFSIYIVEDEPAPIHPSYYYHPFSGRTVIETIPIKCPEGQKRDNNGECRKVERS